MKSRQNNINQHIKLEPIDNDRLANLCGLLDKNIRQIEVFFDVEKKPGISNLLSILGAATGKTPKEACSGITRYGDLKSATAEAVVELLRPVQEKYHTLADDPGETSRLIAKGAEKAREIASVTLSRARENVGLLSQ